MTGVGINVRIGTLIRHNTTTDQNERTNDRPSVGVNAIVIETEWEEECTEELNSTQLHSVWWSQDTIIDQLKVAELIQRRQHVCRESFRIYQMQLVPMFCLCTDSTAPPPLLLIGTNNALGMAITGMYILLQDNILCSFPDTFWKSPSPLVFGNWTTMQTEFYSEYRIIAVAQVIPIPFSL